MAILMWIVATVLSANVVQAKPFPSNLTYNFELQYENKVSAISDILDSAIKGLDMRVIPAGVMMRLVPLHIYASDSKMKRQVAIMVGAKVDGKHMLETYDIKGATIYHNAPSGLPLALGFKGLNQSEIENVIGRLKRNYTNASAVFPIPFQILPQAFADNPVDGGGGGGGEKSPVKEEGLAGKLVDSTWACVQGAVHGAHAIIVDPWIKFGEGMYAMSTDGARFWGNTWDHLGRIKDSVIEGVSSPVETAKSAWKSRASMSNEEGSKWNCSLVGGGGAGAYMLKLAKGGMAANAALPTGSVATRAALLEKEAKALDAAKKLGFQTGKRQKLLKAIDDAVEKFSDNPEAHIGGLPNTFKGLQERIYSTFKSSAEPGSAQWIKERAQHHRNEVRRLRDLGDSDLIQFVRHQGPERMFGWDEFYQAWYQRPVTNGSQHASGGDGHLAFIPGPTPGSVKVFGFAGNNGDPAKLIASQSSKPLNIKDVKILQPAGVEGIHSWGMSFEAIIMP